MSAPVSGVLDRAAINRANCRGRDADRPAPRTDLYVRNSRLRLLSRMSNVEASIRVRVQYAWSRKPAIKERADAVPTDVRPLASLTKRVSPHAPQPMPKGLHRSEISRHSVVLIETLRNAPQPCPDLVQRLVHPGPQLLFDLLQLRHHPLVRRLSPDHE